MVLVPALYGLGTAIPPVVSAVVGVYPPLPQRLVAALLALASGALLTGLAFELFQPAVRTVGIGPTAVSLFAGTGLYVFVKYRLGTGDGPEGYPLLAAIVFDGLAENTGTVQSYRWRRRPRLARCRNHAGRLRNRRPAYRLRRCRRLSHHLSAGVTVRRLATGRNTVVRGRSGLTTWLGWQNRLVASATASRPSRHWVR